MTASDEPYEVVVKAGNVVEIFDSGKSINEAVRKDLESALVKGPTFPSADKTFSEACADVTSNFAQSTSEPPVSSNAASETEADVLKAEAAESVSEPPISPEIQQLLSLKFHPISLGSSDEVSISFGDTADDVFFNLVSNGDAVNAFVDGIADLYTGES